MADTKARKLTYDELFNSTTMFYINQDCEESIRCPHCGKEFHIYGDKRRKYCSHECYIADRFKGGDCNE